jgi:hypothetical protein
VKNILKTIFVLLILLVNFLAWVRLMVSCLWNHRWPSVVEILVLVILFLVGVIINPTRGS